MIDESQMPPFDIETEVYFTAADGLKGMRFTIPQHEILERTTFCVLILKDGSVVTGESAAKEDSRKYAREDALSKIEQLIYYATRDKLNQKRKESP